MKYFRVFMFLVLLVANYFAIKGSFALLNVPKDSAVVLGIFLLSFVMLADVDVIRTYLKRRKNVKSN